MCLAIGQMMFGLYLLVAQMQVRLCSNLVVLLNSEKALIEMLKLCGVTVHLQWIVNATI